MHGTPHEQALLAFRWLHCAGDARWADFPRYWMAFNALYNAVRRNGEPEVEAVIRVIRLFYDAPNAEACLTETNAHIEALIAVPPGDDRRRPTAPNYREKATYFVNQFRRSSDPVERLAAIMAIVYQVRCNLVHGSKDPVVMRDQDLVSACTPILAVVVSRLQDIMEGHHHVPVP